MSKEAGGAESGAEQFAVDKPSDSPWGFNSNVISCGTIRQDLWAKYESHSFPYPRTLVCPREWDAGEANLFGP